MPTYYIDPVNGADANDGLGWWRLSYSAGHTAAPAPGTTVTGAGGATGIIISTTLASGTWAGNNAAGYFYMYGRNGTAFANGENITWTGGSCTNAQGTPYDAIYSSFKTVKKSFAAGDIILVAESPETAAAGTVTATNGSVTVSTTNDLTAVLAAYTVIRIGGDNTLYMVQSRTNSTITLNRPYRGNTGAGKGLTYYTGLPTSSANDWQPTAMVGTAASPITVTCGVNPATLAQDGFTILYGNNANYLMAGTWTFANLSRLVMLYWNYGFNATINDSIFTTLIRFRCGTYAGTWNRVTVNSLVQEEGYFGYNAAFNGCVINNLETANTAVRGVYLNGTVVNLLINGWKNTGYSGHNALDLAGTIIGLTIIDPLFDELNSGCTNINTYAAGYFKDVIIRNPIFGSGTVFSNPSGFAGDIALANVGGSATDHRRFIGSSEANKYTEVDYDASVFNTTPSVKLTFVGPSAYPTTIRHYIPCDAGIPKTVSVYFRKSSSPAYGSSSLPIMRLRWTTGTAPNLVSNVCNVTMVDTNNTWLQYSYAVTPTIKGAIIMELIFQGGANNSLAWYDDIGVA